MKKYLPRVNNHIMYSTKMTTDWDINKFIKELEKRAIEHTLGVDCISTSHTISFNIRFREKDKGLIMALSKALFGTVKQG